MGDAKRITIYFDGTGNNKDLGAAKGVQTNVARLFELDTAKGTNLARNSGHAPRHYDAHDRSGESEKIYFDGVGSQRQTSGRSIIEGATGLGAQGRIDQAYDVLVAFHNKYPDDSINVNIVGFSRGASQARSLANKFIQNGVPKLDEQGKHTGEFLIAPGQAHVNKLGIFDTVATDGLPNTDTHLGKNLEINKNVDSTTHLVAMNEYRDTFRLTSALRRDDNADVEEIRFAGAHSQVGGGYRNDVLAAGPLALMYERLGTAGIELNPMQHEDVQRIAQYNELIEDPQNVQRALIDSRLKHGNRAFVLGEDGTFKTINNRPFPLERGTLNIFDRQNQPFKHEAAGRLVIFEQGDRLSRSAPARLFEELSTSLKELGKNVLAAAARFIGMDTRSDAIEESKDVYELLKTERAVTAQEQMSLLSSELTTSRPTAAYIESLDLKPVPIPLSNVLDHQPLLQDPQRVRSFKVMEQKAVDINPSAIVSSASETERKATSGMLIAMDDYHVLQKVSQSENFVIHDRRDLKPSQTLEVGRSTAILHSKGNEDRPLRPSVMEGVTHDLPSFKRR